MRVIVFVAIGMVGAGALREALDAHEVESVLVIGRQPCGVEHPKLRELVLPDLFDFAAIEDQLVGYDACIWEIGISSMGLDEVAYARITEELTLAWARALLRLNPGMSFCYCSAAGGRRPWHVASRAAARRGRAEIDGVPTRRRCQTGLHPSRTRHRSRTRAYQLGIVLLKPLFLFSPLLVRAFPFFFTTSEALDHAMLRVVEGRADRFILESADIKRIAA